VTNSYSVSAAGAAAEAGYVDKRRRLTKAQRRLSYVPVTSVRCSHCNQQVAATFIDLLWQKVSNRFWFDVEVARAWYLEELRLRGLLREYDDRGWECPV